MQSISHSERGRRISRPLRPWWCFSAKRKIPRSAARDPSARAALAQDDLLFNAAY